MSPRAAWRLERLGFRCVYDYVPGKMDWLSFGLPHEGTAKLAGDALRPDAPTCSVDARLGEVRFRLREEGATYCVAVDAEGIVAGLVQGSALDAHPAQTIEQAMEFGVTTVRPSEELGPLRERLKSSGVEGIVVTNSDGRFLGLLVCDDSADGNKR